MFRPTSVFAILFLPSRIFMHRFFMSVNSFSLFKPWPPEGAEFIKFIPAFKKESLNYGHKRLKLSQSNVFHLKSPLFLGAGLLMKENIKIPGEQLPKMAGAEKRILKKALRAETIVSLPPLASSNDI